MTVEQEKVMYTAKTHTTGGRAGASRSDDGRLDVRLSIPGAAGNGTNPANGIILNTTGASGGLTVTGDTGSANNSSGGTIQSTTSHGISLTPDERQLWVIDAPNSYVHAFDVTRLPRRISSAG